jgi:hypothetical protein
MAAARAEGGEHAMAQVTGIALAANQDGRLELVAITGRGSMGAPGGVWHARQIAPNGDWTGWDSLGQPPGGVSSHAPAAARHANGCLEAVVISDDGSVWHRGQITPNGDAWSAWQPLDRPGGQAATATPVLAQNQNGHLEVFVVQGDDNPSNRKTIWHTWQQAGAGWSGWHSLDQPGSSAYDAIAVARNTDGRLELFADERSQQGNRKAIWHRRQDPTGPGGWSPWSSLGAPPEPVRPGAPVLALSSNGHLLLFTVASDGSVWFRRKLPTGAGGWTQWTTMGRNWFLQMAVGMDVGGEAAGRLVLVANSQEHRLWHQEQLHSSGFDWFGWSSFGTSSYDSPGLLTNPTLASNADGRLELFLLSDAGVHQYTQTAPTEEYRPVPVWSAARVWSFPGEMAPTAPARQ